MRLGQTAPHLFAGIPVSIVQRSNTTCSASISACGNGASWRMAPGPFGRDDSEHRAAPHHYLQYRDHGIAGDSVCQMNVDGSGFSNLLVLRGRKVASQSAELRSVSGGELMLIGKGGRSLRYWPMPQYILSEFCLSHGWFRAAPRRGRKPRWNMGLHHGELEHATLPPGVDDERRRCRGLEVVAHQFCDVVAMLDGESKLCSNHRTVAYFGREVSRYTLH